MVDSAGNRVRTGEELIYYDDVRYDWQVQENNDLSIWYHDRSESFGRQVFNIADLAFEGQRQLFGERLSFPIRIIIDNDDAEFATWHSYVSEFVGGQAFSPLGITTQIATSDPPNESWPNDVIPHEISHLYFYQVTQHPMSIAPSWLNEGLAQYNEFIDNKSSIELAQEAILDAQRFIQMKNNPTRKVIAYITRGELLLVFRHPHHPEAGIQLPAGTVNENESLVNAVLREAEEETGLTGFEIRAYLGEQDQDITSWGKDEIHRRYFYHLTFDGAAPNTWQHYENDPSEGSQDSILFEFTWVQFPDDVPQLIADQGAFLDQIEV